MIKQPARVIAENNSNYLLETLPKSACPQCEAGKGCGGGLLAKAFSNKTYQISINKNKQLHINELVQIGIPSSLLVRASFIVYLLPLLLMVIMAIIAGSLTDNQDSYTVTGAIIGFIVGIIIARNVSSFYFKSTITNPILIDEQQESCWYKAE